MVPVLVSQESDSFLDNSRWPDLFVLLPGFLPICRSVYNSKLSVMV